MIGDWLREEQIIADLSQIYGVSRTTVHKWRKHYEEKRRQRSRKTVTVRGVRNSPERDSSEDHGENHRDKVKETGHGDHEFLKSLRLNDEMIDLIAG